ncbi:MAG: hypothetical protein OXE85_11295 [Roseovarius sp.]|nr:hypothetical protein [Roseovarius sp.]
MRQTDSLRQIFATVTCLHLACFFRPTRLWDTLVAALQFKSHAGQSFGNKLNLPARNKEPLSPLDTAFKGASYAQRYDLLCKRFVWKGLYSSATFIASPRSAVENGQYRHSGDLTSPKNLLAVFAGHIASIAATSCNGCNFPAFRNPLHETC